MIGSCGSLLIKVTSKERSELKGSLIGPSTCRIRVDLVLMILAIILSGNDQIASRGRLHVAQGSQSGFRAHILHHYV